VFVVNHELVEGCEPCLLASKEDLAWLETMSLRASGKSLVFLDFDGVLNHAAWLEKLFLKGIDEWSPGMSFDRECVARLNRIIDETGALVVVSSSWRHAFVAFRFCSRLTVSQEP